MQRIGKMLVHAGAVLALALGAHAANAQGYNEVIDDTPSAEAMAFDLVIVRPLGLVTTVAGIGIFVLALPINLITFNFNDPARRLIVEPATFTFARDLGALD